MLHIYAAVAEKERAMIWERVQQRLASQTQPRCPCQPDDHSFLVGKLYDDRGNRMGASHASKGGRRWRYYVSRAALTGRTQEAGSVVRIPAPEIESRVATAVRAHLAARVNAIDGNHIDRRDGRGDHAIAQHESGPTRRDLPSEDDVRNAIDSVTVSATRIEIVLNESIVSEGQDRVLTLPWTRASSRRRREIIQGVSEAQRPLRDANESVRRFHQGVGRRSPLADDFLSTLPRPSSRSPCAKTRASARFG